MKAIALFLALGLAAPAWAEALSLPIEAPEGAGLVRITVPEAAYRAMRAPDLADLRVRNGAGEVVPSAVLPARSAIEAQRLRRPLVPMPTQAGSADGRMVIEAGGERVRIELDGGPAQAAPVRAQMVAVEDGFGALDAIELIVPDSARFEARVSVQGSEDLRAWRTLASRVPVLALGEADARIVQLRVPLSGATVRYLRIDWDAPPATLPKAVDLVREARTGPVREWAALDATPDGDTLAYVSPGLYPVDALRLAPADANDVVAATVHSRPAVSARWQWRARSVGYRLAGEGGVQEGAPTEVARRRDPLWRLKLDTPPVRPPQLLIGWVPEQVVFVARGAGPFTLEAGGDGPSAWRPVRELVPGYDTPQAAPMREALVRTDGAAVPAPARDAAPWQPGTHWVLWGVLLLGVGVLGAMAGGVWRGLRGKDSENR